MHESEHEVLARIERTRSRMGETIEQIGDRVNPDRVQAELKARARAQVHEVKSNVKHKARNAMRDIEHGVSDAGRGVWDMIRDNPIPAGMVGVGLAWLLANGATGHDHDGVDYEGYATGGVRGYTGYGAAGPAEPVGYGGGIGEPGRGFTTPAGAETEDQSRTEEARERVSEAASSVKERASETAEHARDTAREKVHEVRHRASEMAHRAGDEMHDLQHRAATATRQAGRQVRRAERRVEHAVQDNPLAAGAIAAALGLAAGLMVPESRREQEMFGPARDRLMDRAERTVRSAGEKAREAAKETVSRAASSAASSAVDEMTGGGNRSRMESVSEPGRSNG